VEVDILEDVDDGGLQTTCQCERRVMFRVAADLEDALAHDREGGGEVRGGRGLADPALAVDGEDLRAVNALGRVHVDLDGAFAVKAPEVGDFVARAHLVPLSM
jgi:hypothetical protein